MFMTCSSSLKVKTRSSYSLPCYSTVSTTYAHTNVVGVEIDYSLLGNTYLTIMDASKTIVC